MTPASELEELIDALRRGEAPPGTVTLKKNPVRHVARAGDTVVKLFLVPRRHPATREATALRKASARRIPVPELVADGEDWIATAWIEGRSATRDDLPMILPVVERMHRSGMLHCDLHLGNFLVHDDGVSVLDVQRARFWPALPHMLRRWELGRLAYSLGEPLPKPLEGVRFWRDRRAHQHWRSRTRRCIRESSRFTSFEARGLKGYRLREVDPQALARALETLDQGELIWPRPGGHVYRSSPWIVKEHASARAARAAWIAGHGLEARGFSTALPVAWLGHWLVMKDAGRTIVEWVEAAFAEASAAEQEEMMRALVDLMADLHRRGIYHADLKACNITWTPGTPPRLLDYEKVLFRLRVPRRRRMKNLAQLNSALPDIIPGPLRERGLQRYVERSGFRGDVRRLRRDVIDLSLRRDHRWHGC